MKSHSCFDLHFLNKPSFLEEAQTSQAAWKKQTCWAVCKRQRSDDLPRSCSDQLGHLEKILFNLLSCLQIVQWIPGIQVLWAVTQAGGGTLVIQWVISVSIINLSPILLYITPMEYIGLLSWTWMVSLLFSVVSSSPGWRRHIQVYVGIVSHVIYVHVCGDM